MKKLTLALLVTAAFVPAIASAHQAGDVLVRAGFIHVMPNDSSDDVLGLGEFDVKSNTQMGFTGSYMITDNIGVELLAATPFKHRVGLGNLGEVAEVKHLPPSLMAQYYFMDAKSSWRPYLGAGINYTTFFDEKFINGYDGALTNLSLKDSWGVAVQGGMDYVVGEHMLLNASVWWMDIDTDVRFTDPNGQHQSISTSIDPVGVMLAVGYRF